MRLILYQFSTFVKLNKSFTLPINIISLKQKKTKLLCGSLGSGVDLIENKRTH